MSKKAFRPPRIAPLQRIVAESITDPAEQARLAKLYKQIKRKQREQEAAEDPKGAKGASKAAAKKAFKPPRIAPLQRVVAESITDPAEQAALDEARKRIKRKQREQEAAENRKGAKRASKAAAKKRT
jgi:hypothetical protein